MTRRQQSSLPCGRPSRNPDRPGCVIRGEHVADCDGDERKPCMGCLPRPAEPGEWLCRGCQADLGKALERLPEYALELHRGLSPANRVSDGGHVALAGSPDFAAGRGVVALVCQMAHDTAWMAREVAEVKGVTHPRIDATAYPLQAVRTACTWLGPYAAWMGQQRTAPEWLGTVLELRRDSFALIDSAARSRFRLPDACPEEGCSADLWATVYDVGDDRKNRIWCRGEIPHEWDALQWLRLGRRLGYGKVAG